MSEPSSSPTTALIQQEHHHEPNKMKSSSPSSSSSIHHHHHHHDAQSNHHNRASSLDVAFSSFAAPTSSQNKLKSKSSNVRVVARIRPLNDKEVREDCTECIFPILPFVSCDSGSDEGVVKKKKEGVVERRRQSFSPRCDTPTTSNKTLLLPTADESSSPTKFFTSPSNNTNTNNINTSPSPHKALSSSPSSHATSLSISTNNTSQKSFSYDAVFPPTTTQEEVYTRSVGDAVRRNIFRGYNTTIIAYGQTGSGKTFTMHGKEYEEEMERREKEKKRREQRRRKKSLSRRKKVNMDAVIKEEEEEVKEKKKKEEDEEDGETVETIETTDTTSTTTTTNTSSSSISKPPPPPPPTPSSPPPSSSSLSPSSTDGIIPRAIHDLFKAKRRHASAGDVSITLTYIEIYNDVIRDLLSSSSKQEQEEAHHHHQPKEEIKIIDNVHGESGVILKNTTSLNVNSAEEVLHYIKEASCRRVTGSTAMNATSSRSHSVCVLHVTIKPAVKDALVSSSSSSSSNTNTPSNTLQTKKGGSSSPTLPNFATCESIHAKLTLVDLAGSERLKQTKVEGLQKQESICINKDLFVLGNVVSALADQQALRERNGGGGGGGGGGGIHVPYRDCKLTRLLRESLGGNCCTVMVACISPADSNLEESINTLRYASRTRSISNSIKQNVAKAVLTPEESAALRKENKGLKRQVLVLKECIKSLEMKMEEGTCGGGGAVRGGRRSWGGERRRVGSNSTTTTGRKKKVMMKQENGNETTTKSTTGKVASIQEDQDSSTSPLSAEQLALLSSAADDAAATTEESLPPPPPPTELDKTPKTSTQSTENNKLIVPASSSSLTASSSADDSSTPLLANALKPPSFGAIKVVAEEKMKEETMVVVESRQDKEEYEQEEEEDFIFSPTPYDNNNNNYDDDDASSSFPSHHSSFGNLSTTTELSTDFDTEHGFMLLKSKHHQEEIERDINEQKAIRDRLENEVFVLEQKVQKLHGFRDEILEEMKKKQQQQQQQQQDGTSDEDVVKSVDDFKESNEEYKTLQEFKKHLESETSTLSTEKIQLAKVIQERELSRYALQEKIQDSSRELNQVIDRVVVDEEYQETSSLTGKEQSNEDNLQVFRQVLSRCIEEKKEQTSAELCGDEDASTSTANTSNSKAVDLLSMIETEITNIDNIASELQALEQEKSCLEEAKQETQVELESLEAQVADQKTLLQTFEGKVADEQALLKQLKQESIEQEEKIKNSKETKKSLDQEIRETEQSRLDLRKEKDLLKKQVEVLASERSELIKEVQEYQDMTTLAAQLSEEEEQRKKAEEEIRKMKKEMALIKAERDALLMKARVTTTTTSVTVAATPAKTKASAAGVGGSEFDSPVALLPVTPKSSGSSLRSAPRSSTLATTTTRTPDADVVRRLDTEESEREILRKLSDELRDDKDEENHDTSDNNAERGNSSLELSPQRESLDKTISSTLMGDVDLNCSIADDDDEESVKSEQEAIRRHAAKMLYWADKAIERRGSGSSAGSGSLRGCEISAAPPRNESNITVTPNQQESDSGDMIEPSPSNDFSNNSASTHNTMKTHQPVQQQQQQQQPSSQNEKAPLKRGASLPPLSGKKTSIRINPAVSHSDTKNTGSVTSSETSTIATLDDKENRNNTYVRSRSVLVSDDKKEVIETYVNAPPRRGNLSNFDQMGGDDPTLCSCSSSIFSGREEHMEFFLPKLGMACNCNKNGQECHHCESPRHQDPTSLKNILRPWQVDFLASMNIHKADQLLRAYKKNPRGMARAMKQWRIDQEMQAVRSKSCYIALHIWCRTSKVVLKSVKGLRKPQQKKDVYNDSINSVAHQPDFLEISFSSDYSVSTLGIASIADGAVLGETMEI